MLLFPWACNLELVFYKPVHPAQILVFFFVFFPPLGFPNDRTGKLPRNLCFLSTLYMYGIDLLKLISRCVSNLSSAVTDFLFSVFFLPTKGYILTVKIFLPRKNQAILHAKNQKKGLRKDFKACFAMMVLSKFKTRILLV